jgi:uncharacterized membrane protein YkvA (DUF1232 family)
VDLEQREGRINRFDGLVVRRNVRLDYPLSAIPHRDGSRSNIWDELFREIEERPRGTQHFKHGLFPHWVYEPVVDQPLRIRRHIAIFEGSRDRAHYERLKKYLFYYRLAFGQARQQDLLDRIVDRSDEARIRAGLTACMVNLSPFAADHSWIKAQREARKLLQTPELLRELVSQTKALFNRRASELGEIEPQIRGFWQVAERVADQRRSKDGNDMLAIAALTYLMDPYDQKFDEIAGIGLQDDIDVVKHAAAGIPG